MTDFIASPRPLFNLSDKPKKGSERLVAGSDTSGVIIDVTKEGLEISGYYAGFTPGQKYAVLREPVTISWEEFDKIKELLNKGRKKATFDRNETDYDEEYLKGLPIVTINGNKYYIDPHKRERRAVNKPSAVWRF